MAEAFARISAKFLLTLVVTVALLIVVFVVMVGGIVCIKDSKYSFTEYLHDLAWVYKLLSVAVVAATISALIDRGKTESKS